MKSLIRSFKSRSIIALEINSKFVLKIFANIRAMFYICNQRTTRSATIQLAPTPKRASLNSLQASLIPTKVGTSFSNCKNPCNILQNLAQRACHSRRKNRVNKEREQVMVFPVGVENSSDDWPQRITASRGDTRWDGRLLFT